MYEIQVVNKKTYLGKGEYIGRPSPLGNPFFMKDESYRDSVCNQYKLWLEKNKNIPAIRKELLRLLNIAKKGPLVLICWCAPKRCHGESIRDMLKSLD